MFKNGSLFVIASLVFLLAAFFLKIALNSFVSAASQQTFAPVAGFGDVGGITKITDGFSVAKTSTQDCSASTCKSVNSWNLGFSSNSAVNVNTVATFSYDLSTISDPGSASNLTFRFGGCWQGGNDRSCNNGSNPGFDNNSGSAYFEIKNGNNWEQFGQAVNLGNNSNSGADFYNVYQAVKPSNLSAGYLQNGILKIRIRTTGRTSQSLDVFQVTDFATVTVDFANPTPSPTIVPNPTPTPGPGSLLSFSDATIQAGILFGNKITWGVNWADFDNDGNVDLFVSGHFNLPVLYHSNGNGTFGDVTNSAGMNIQTDRHGCVWGDYNADRFLDLICVAGAQNGTGSKPNQLFRNNQNGTFSEVAAELGVVDGPSSARGANWLDFDADGDLDFFSANKLRTGFYPSQLFENTGGTFIEIGAIAGVADNVHTRSSSWADYDGDGDPDLLITPGSKLILHKNNGNGTFTLDSALQAGLTSDKNYGSAWGDFDNDGDLDLFVSRLSGNKSILYWNNGNGTFTDVTTNSSINTNQATVGQWGDFDNDGDLDLFVVNGLNSTTSVNTPDMLYINNSDGTFADKAVEAGVSGPPNGNGISAAWADYDKDGFLDLFVTNGEEGIGAGPVKLYHNSRNDNNWLEMKLASDSKNTKALGAKVSIVSGGKSQFRQLTDNVSQYGQNDQIVHFGVGQADLIDSITITWPNGQLQQMTNVFANQILTVTKP